MEPQTIVSSFYGVELVGDWTLNKLPDMSNSVLQGSLSVEDLVREMNEVLWYMPPAHLLCKKDASRLLVELGIWGSSVASYYQKKDLDLAQRDPGAGLDYLRVSEERVRFQSYFQSLALASGTGHPDRDAYASLIKWNYPDIKASWNGCQIGRMPSVFEDGKTRTYTGNIGEVLGIELFNRCETLEKAANDALLPIWSGEHTSRELKEIQERFNLAYLALAAVRRLLIEFHHGDQRGSMTATHFMDVFRQYAVHWGPGDIPPSGTQDIEFIRRDLMSGMQFPGYREHIRKIYPGLLSEEREQLSRDMSHMSLPEVILDRCSLSRTNIDDMSDSELTLVLKRRPEVAFCYFLLRSNARLSASHLMISKKFLYKPARKREEDGTAVRTPVPNDKGITGMPETVLDRLNQARKAHPLVRLDRMGHKIVSEISGVKPVIDISMEEVMEMFSS